MNRDSVSSEVPLPLNPDAPLFEEQVESNWDPRIVDPCKRAESEKPLDDSPMGDSIFDLAYTSNSGANVPLIQYEGRPLLLVNTASKCGFTPQYQGLQKLHDEFGNLGLIGFPCNQFGGQEPANNEQILDFCERNYGVTFPLSEKVSVNGPRTHPIFTFLKDRTRGLLGSSIKWNFTKFLVHPDGKTVERFQPSVRPETLRDRIVGLTANASGSTYR